MRGSKKGNVRFIVSNLFLFILLTVFCSLGSTVQPIYAVKEYDDVRGKDLSRLNLIGGQGLIASLTFNQKTVWPPINRLPKGIDPKVVLEIAKNPGLGVRPLHRQGITGKGVNVAIIDQPLYQDHPEFAGKIVKYFDTGCNSESSMHGPAVASLLVGNNCGTAPGAKLYFVAAPSWTRDSSYQAKALDWIVEQNKSLPASQKIRVVSVSAAPSGISSPFIKNQQMWDLACARAEMAGILVLDCTSHRGFIGACWYNFYDPENIIRYTPGFPGLPWQTNTQKILVPASPRTVAEEYNKGDFSYQYTGRGGLSWTIPYCAGVLAMGWQVNPRLSPQQMLQLLFLSAYVTPGGDNIINPRGFINLVKKTRAS
jgi:serine protease AprX